MSSMNRRQFIGTAGAGAAGAAALGLPGCATPPQTPSGKQWNILWITCEDISPDLGCYGVTDVETPYLDQLAAEGIRYNAFSHAGVCAPTRAGIITCMYPISIGAMHMRTGNGGSFASYPTDLPRFGYEAVPPPEVKCFTEYLRAAGYYCTNRDKTDYQFQPPRTAWDHIIRFNQGGADWRGREEGQPFFCVINYTSTHESQIRSPRGRVAKHDPQKVTLPPYYPDTPAVRNDYACYLENIENLDLEVKKVLDWLEEDGLTDETVIFFYGDHGRGLPRAKRWIYDSGLLAPLIVRWPGVIEPGQVDDGMVAFIDFGATALSIAGIPMPEHFHGRPFLGDYTAPRRDYIYAARDRMDTVRDRYRGVRDTQFKYIRNYEPWKPYVQPLSYRDQMPTMQELLRMNEEGTLDNIQALWFRQSKPVEELYDIIADPHEVNSIADDPAYAADLERLRGKLDEWLDEVGDMGYIAEPELVNMFWPGGVQPVTEAPVINKSGGKFAITCATEGASIAWTTGEGDDAHWKLYTEPLALTGPGTLRSCAIRIGFKESDEARMEV